MSFLSRLRNGRWRRRDGLLALGLVCVVASLAIAREVLVVFDSETQLLLAAYIGLQVVGWLAILEWYRD